MAYNKNLKQTGWFYHAPAKPKDLPPQGAPPASQIPGLSDVSHLPEDDTPKKTWIKDTDSKYVVLAKQGGRPDLLRFRSPKPPKENAVGYPRCDWFYLEDNAIEDAEQNPPDQQTKHEFMLPDYMVHHAYKSRGDHPDHNGYSPSSSYAPRRAAFQHDNNSAFERERNPTDKTKKLPESRQDGYGIRSEKIKNKPVKHTTPKPERGRAPQPEYEGNEKKYKPVFKPEEEERPIMSKILSYGYQRDWHDKKNDWDKEQKKFAQEHKEYTGPKEKIVSEYQKGYQGTPPASKTRLSSSPNKVQQAETKMQKKEADNLEKELFKLSNKEKKGIRQYNILGQMIRRISAPDISVQYNILGQPIPPNKRPQV